MYSIRDDTDSYIQLSFKDKLTDIVITDATVSATLYNDDTDAQIVVVPMPHVAADPGVYRGVIPYDTVGIDAGVTVRAQVFADGGTNKRATVRAKIAVKAGSG